MSPPEMNDSGKFSGNHKSNFSQTCSLLSRYLQEKGSFGDLTLGLSSNFQPHGVSTASTTKNLLPEKTGQQVSVMLGDMERAPMTIFYGGQVLVFNDFPADKAKEIMDSAMAMSSRAGSVAMVQKPAESAINLLSCLGNDMMLQSPCVPTQSLVNDLPLARRASLARFFEKRKDRITARAPYQQSNSVGSKAAESKAWLGLAAESPLQTHLH